MVHGCEQFLIRSVVHITLGRISRARSVKAKVLQKAFLLNYDFESNFNETDWVSPLIKRSPHSMTLVYAYLLGIAQTNGFFRAQLFGSVQAEAQLFPFCMVR